MMALAMTVVDLLERRRLLRAVLRLDVLARGDRRVPAPRPVVDVKMLALMRTTFTTRTLATITAVAVLFSAALGFGVNAFA